VSTVSVAGERLHETVSEDDAIDWNRRDYDPYARTKKFGEALVRELLPDVSIVIVRPSVVLGDSRRVETTQFDMARAFSFLASLPVLPFRQLDRIDIVPADWVSEAIVTLHRAQDNAHDTYHLSAGAASETYWHLTDVVSKALGKSSPTYVPLLEKPFLAGAFLAGRFGSGGLAIGAKLLQAFFPYLTYDTVFDNRRIVTEIARRPAAFSSYCVPLLDFARRCRFEYPYAPWPDEKGRKIEPRSNDGESSSRGSSQVPWEIPS
jgi:nucleoside-diphosphate-sugar epimerase